MRAHLWFSAALLVGSAQAAVIDGGSAEISPQGFNLHISSTEADFSLDGVILAFRDQLCFNCLPGMQNSIFVMMVSDAAIGTGSLTVHGVTYPNIFFNDGVALRPSSGMVIQTDSYKVIGNDCYGVPFQMTGFLQVALKAGGPDVPLLLDTPVSGVGEAGFCMGPPDQETVSVQLPIVFTFVPVPEPASGLSVAGGFLVVMGLNRFAARKKRFGG